jgi:hypothetical protein
VQRVGDVLARELDWSRERLGAELAGFAAEARAEGLLAGAPMAASVSVAGTPSRGPRP